MTGSIVMMVIGSVLLLPMAFLVVLAVFHLLGDVLQGMFGSEADIQLSLVIFFLTLIGAGLLWRGIATLPQ